MKESRIKRFFGNINLSYDDLPYLYFPLLAAIILVLIAWYIWGQNALLWGILILPTYLILATQFHLYRSTRRDLENHQNKIQAFFSLYSMLDFKRSLPYMSGWAATPELAIAVLDEIKEYKPDHILELGSGISTIIASYGLRQNGKGTITSLDHDEAYAEKTRRQIRKHNLEDFAHIHYTPLVPHSINNNKWDWYDINNATLPRQIDMLLVDGPPVKTNAKARYPAMPMLAERLNDHAVVILHDAHRPSEHSILEKWKDEFFEFDVEIINTEKGIAILRR